MWSAPFLGPMMAVTLAICLSYIHLDRFRHTGIVREHARRCLQPLASAMDGRKAGSVHWKRICKLAGEEDDSEYPGWPTAEAQHNSPRIWAEMAHSWIFRRAVDAKFATGSAWLSLLCLIYWTGYRMGYLDPIGPCSFMDGLLLATYILLATVIVSVILAAHLGPKMVDRLKALIDDDEREIKVFVGQELQRQAKDSKL